MKFIQIIRLQPLVKKRAFSVNQYGEWISQRPKTEKDQYIAPFIPPIPRPQEPLEQKRARLLWYSRKRGILETDLILSTFAKKHLNSMDQKQLEEYDALLHENDWDIYYWATEAQKVPPHVQKMSILSLIQEHAKNREKEIRSMPKL